MSYLSDSIKLQIEEAGKGPSFTPDMLPLVSETHAEAFVRQQQEEAEQKRIEELPEPSFSEQWNAALEITGLGLRHIPRKLAEWNNLPDDPDYVVPLPDSPEWKQLTQGIEPEYWPRFGEIRSANQAWSLRTQLLTEKEAMETLEKSGWTGKVLEVGTIITDPVTLGSLLLPAGTGLLNTGSRGARALKW